MTQRDSLIELSVAVGTAATRLYRAKRIDAETRELMAQAGAAVMTAANGAEEKADNG
jgi:hypothetical protein